MPLQVWELEGALFRRHVTPSIFAFAEETATIMRDLDMARVACHVFARHRLDVLTPDVSRRFMQSCRLAAVPGQTGAAGDAPSASNKLGGVPARSLPVLARKQLRAASASIQRLTRVVRVNERDCLGSMLTFSADLQVGTSKRLYASIASLLRKQYAENGTPAVCSLRSQLFMALYDSVPSTGAATLPALTELCESDKCQRLISALDACVKVCLPVAAGTRLVCQCVVYQLTALLVKDGYCDNKRLKDILGLVEALEKAAATSALSAQKLVLKLGSRAAQAAGSENSDGGESISRSEDSALLWLADAGMVLRDPPAFHLLLHETVGPHVPHAVLDMPANSRCNVWQIRTLEGVVEREEVPKDDRNLCGLSKVCACYSWTALEGSRPDATPCHLGRLLRTSMLAPAYAHAHACIEFVMASPTQLLAYAVGTREFLLEHRHVVTLNRDVVEKFYPLLADVILDVRALELIANEHSVPASDPATAACRQTCVTAMTKQRKGFAPQTPGALTVIPSDSPGTCLVVQEVRKADDKLVKLMQADAVVRKVSLAYILQRVTVGDLTTAEPLLLAAKEARAV